MFDLNSLELVDTYELHDRKALILQMPSGSYLVEFYQNDQLMTWLDYTGYNLYFVRDAAENYVVGIFNPENNNNE